MVASAFAKQKPRQQRRGGWIEIERRWRHRRNADLLDQPFAKRDIVLEAELRDIGHQEIAAADRQHRQLGAGERRFQQTAPCAYSRASRS